jgi:hypothetical protein|mmetsp:Transcript_51025/g.85370  ORF Transcript_51025/g.85370 Transcript_51025/m.85370 type:complete len:95 (+) Transcript_51025:944-1228(+)
MRPDDVRTATGALARLKDTRWVINGSPYKYTMKQLQLKHLLVDMSHVQVQVGSADVHELDLGSQTDEDYPACTFTAIVLWPQAPIRNDRNDQNP